MNRNAHLQQQLAASKARLQPTRLQQRGRSRATREMEPSQRMDDYMQASRLYGTLAQGRAPGSKSTLLPWMQREGIAGKPEQMKQQLQKYWQDMPSYAQPYDSPALKFKPGRSLPSTN